MDKHADVDSYLASVPPIPRATLEKLRRSIKATAPDAVEGIAYGMPAYKYRGKPLIYFAASKSHCALYGDLVVDNQEELAGYDISKGTWRFPHDRPPPATLVKQLIRKRMAAIDEAEAARSRTRPARR